MKNQKNPSFHLLNIENHTDYSIQKFIPSKQILLDPSSNNVQWTLRVFHVNPDSSGDSSTHECALVTL